MEETLDPVYNTCESVFVDERLNVYASYICCQGDNINSSLPSRKENEKASVKFSRLLPRPVHPFQTCVTEYLHLYLF